MIKVQRVIAPTDLTKNAVKWTQKYLECCDDLNKNPKSMDLKKKKELSENKYRHSAIQKVLKEAMFHGKCAFCERKRDYPHIEHFRPKTDFPSLCFEWNNLLLACEVCNGTSYKGTKFPIDAAGIPLFINPCDEDPNDHLDFIIEADTASELGFIARVKSKTIKGETTRTELGLDRPFLLKERAEHLMPYLYIAEKARAGDLEAKALLAKACAAEYIFAAFARTLVSA
jgi:uncharacterized protein (TIGR02646 family)